MWDNATDYELVQLFGCGENDMLTTITCIADVVAPTLALYVTPPRRISHIIRTGFLVGVALMLDATDTPMLRPGKGKGQDRKKFYDEKTRGWHGVLNHRSPLDWTRAFGTARQLFLARRQNSPCSKRLIYQA